jgi:hypothetical protein
VTFRVNIKKLLVGELLDSDGLDDSREAEEESKLCSVRSNSMDKLEICQSEHSEIVLCTSGSVERIHSQSGVLVMLALSIEP